MDLDVVQSVPVNVSSSVFASPVPVCDSPGVGTEGCWIEPVFAASVPVGGSPGAGVIGGGCDGTPMNVATTSPEALHQADIPLREMMKLMDQSAVQEVKDLDRGILSLVRNLGGNANRFRRERGRAIRAVISEIYSPPRVSAVAKMCPSFGILPGFALDHHQ